jgi:hypothetical protein
MREALRGNHSEQQALAHRCDRQSEAIRGNQSPSEPIRANQSQSEAITAYRCERRGSHADHRAHGAAC